MIYKGFLAFCSSSAPTVWLRLQSVPSKSACTDVYFSLLWMDGSWAHQTHHFLHFWILRKPQNQQRSPLKSNSAVFLGWSYICKATDSPWKHSKSRVKMVGSCGVSSVAHQEWSFYWVSRVWALFSDGERKCLSGTSITWPCLSIISLLLAGLSVLWTRLGCQAWCSRACSL